MNLPPRELTPKQRKAFNFLVNYWSTTGQQASYKVLAEYMGWASLNTAVGMIEALKKKRVLLKSEEGKPYKLPFATSEFETICEELIKAVEEEDTALYAHAKGRYDAIIKRRGIVDNLQA